MSRRLDIAFSTKKDAEIVRYLQLKEPNRSVIIVSTIEYYLKTGSYIKIGDVCTDKIKNESTQRMALRVPEDSLTGQWIEEQLAKNVKGLLKTKISNILRKSLSVISVGETEYTKPYEDVIDEMEKVEKASNHIDITAFNTNESPVRIAEPVQTPTILQDNTPKKDMKPVKAPQSMMDKLMPKFED